MERASAVGQCSESNSLYPRTIQSLFVLYRRQVDVMIRLTERHYHDLQVLMSIGKQRHLFLCLVSPFRSRNRGVQPAFSHSDHSGSRLLVNSAILQLSTVCFGSVNHKASWLAQAISGIDNAHRYSALHFMSIGNMPARPVAFAGSPGQASHRRDYFRTLFTWDPHSYEDHLNI